MRSKSLIALAVAAGFAITAQAGDKDKNASAGAGSSNSGAEKMFQALDKNKDGFMSREEVKGTPHDKDFATLDKNNDGKLSRQEHAAAPEHAGDKAGAGGTTSSEPKAPSKTESKK